MCVFVCVCVHVRVSVCVCARLHVSMYTSKYVCLRAFVHMVCVHACA